MSTKNKFTGYILVLAAASMWALLGPLCLYIYQEGISPLESAFWRAFFGWIFFLAHASFKGQVKIPSNYLPILAVFGLICVSIFYSSYLLAISRLGVGIAAVLLYTAPAWVAVLSPFLLNEKITLAKALCVSMTIAGVILICLGPQLSSNANVPLDSIGIGIGLIAGLTYAQYFIFGKKILYRFETPTVFSYALPLGMIPLLPFIHFTHKTPTAWFLLLSLGFISSYAAFSACYAGLKRLEATQASVIATFEPMLAAAFGFILFNETFGIFSWLGSALIIGAVFLVVLSGQKAPRPNIPEGGEA